MITDTITDIMQDASEIVHYDEIGIPLYIRESLLSYYPERRALCHWHEDLEWVGIRSGQMYYYVNGKQILLSKGDCILVNSRQMHYGYSVHGGECDFFCILCHPRMFTENKFLYQRYVLPVLSNASLEYIKIQADQPEAADILHLLASVVQLKREHPAAYELEASALLTIVWRRMLVLYPMLPSRDTMQDADPELTSQRDMVSYIYHHYAETLGLDAIAASGNVCRSKCCQIFKRYLQQSPIDFLNSYRLEVSCNLLTSTDMAISDICTACGFNHQSYYSKLFLRTYGCTPRDFRKSHATSAK